MGSGPMPISHRVNREAVVVLGWGRAILLQLAHPLVAAGVGAHSGFDAGALAYVHRMRRTIGAMLSLTFGTESEIRETAGRINAIHHRVNGRLDCAVGGYAAGTPYDATDPALLTWVHATLIDSQLRTYALFVGPLGARRRGSLLRRGRAGRPATRGCRERAARHQGRARRLPGRDAAGRSARGRRGRPAAGGGPARAAGKTLGRSGAVARPAHHPWGCCPRPSAPPIGFPWRAEGCPEAAVGRGGAARRPAGHAAGAARVARRPESALALVVVRLRAHRASSRPLSPGCLPDARPAAGSPFPGCPRGRRAHASGRRSGA